MLKKPASRLHPRIHQFLAYVSTNKLTVLVGCCITAYIVTLPFAHWFEGDITAQHRAEEREKGNRKYALDGRE